MDQVICTGLMALWLVLFLWAIGPAKMDNWLGGPSLHERPRK